jgi:hypothetical protein
MLPFFLERAREWWAVADILRERGASEDDPALWVWREAAWCHLLFASGRYDLIVARLKAVFRDVSGAPTPPTPRGVRPAELLASAVDLFEWLRAAVSVRHPSVFGRLTCC